MSTPKDPLGKLISEHTHYSKNKDDLLDIHIGNPLRRIAELLEEIKRQKALSFTLKGSLGIAGVFLALTIFGVFGGGKMLCDKGEQSQIGIVRILDVKDTESASDLPILSYFLDYFAPRRTYNRAVLIKQDKSAVRMPYSRNVNLSQYVNYEIIATGNYDSCSQTLTLNNPQSIEFFNLPTN